MQPCTQSCMQIHAHVLSILLLCYTYYIFSCYSSCSTASSTTGSPSTALAALHHCRNPRATVPRCRPPARWDDLVDDSARDVGSVVCALTPPPSVLIVEGKRFMHSSPVADLLKPVQPCLHAQAKQTIVAASATELAVQAQPDALVLPNAFPHKGPDLWVSLTCGSANLEPPKHLTTEYTLGKDSQEWCTAMVLSFICISSKSNSWDETHPLLGCVPLPMTAHTALIRISNSNFTLHEFLDALRLTLSFHWVPLWNARCEKRRLRLVLYALCYPNF